MASVIILLAMVATDSRAAARPNIVFFLADDLGEETNLAAKESQRVEKLRDELHACKKSVGAKFPIRNPNYDATKPSDRAAKRNLNP